MRAPREIEHVPLFPVCLFYFTMEETQGWYTWVAEPVVTETGATRLAHHEQASCELLDRAALDLIVEKVNRWYDAYLKSAAIASECG